jgi:uncharacterized SAM-binding protein YcdF (DUF218 family)
MSRSRVRWGVRLVLLLALAWAGGLVWFVLHLDDPTPDPETRVDAIVVLTGGSLRIEEGLDLLMAGKGRTLFVSGVHTGVDAADMLRLKGKAPGWVECCVVLGHEASNTVGNAVETAGWLAEKHFHTIRLVTANYHMRRSLLEFRRILPADIRIIPNPVFPEGARQSFFSANGGSLHLIVTEYLKFLAALARALILPGHTFSHDHPLGF